MKTCNACGGLKATEPMEIIAGTPCSCVEGPSEKRPSPGALGVIGGSTAELIAARELLRRWITRYAPGNKPGGWDYDKNVVELIETSAALLGIEDPWRQ